MFKFDATNSVPDQLRYKEIIKCHQAGVYIGNDRCQANALSYALRHQNVASIIGVAQVFNNDTCVAHFIVKLNDGSYIDPTYGNLSGILDSYHIQIEEYTIGTFVPNRELTHLKNYLFSLLPWYKRILRNNNY